MDSFTTGLRRCSRGVDGRAVHQRGVVVVLDKVALLALPTALLGLVGDGDVGAVRRVVEVDDVHVEHQHGRTGDLGA